MSADIRFIYFTDEEKTEIGVPLNLITSIEFDPDEEDHDEDQLTVYMEGDEYYEVLGKDARKAFDEIKHQIRSLNTKEPS